MREFKTIGYAGDLVYQLNMDSITWYFRSNVYNNFRPNIVAGVWKPKIEGEWHLNNS